MLPFTVEQFFRVFAAYNGAIWPLQIAAYLLGAVTVLVALLGTASAQRVVSAALAVMWIWTGIAYHLVFFAAINPAAWLFGAAFVVQGVLFLVAAQVSPGIRAESTGWQGAFGFFLIGYAAVLYPLIGRLLGHSWPEIPSFGLTPCPLVIFTLGVLLLEQRPISQWLVVLPGLWAVIGGSAAILLAVPQDWMLLGGGLIGTSLLLRRSSTIAANAP